MESREEINEVESKEYVKESALSVTSTLFDSIKESVEERERVDVSLISISFFPFPSTNNSSLSSVSNEPSSVAKERQIESISLIVPRAVMIE